MHESISLNELFKSNITLILFENTYSIPNTSNRSKINTVKTHLFPKTSKKTVNEEVKPVFTLQKVKYLFFQKNKTLPLCHKSY